MFCEVVGVEEESTGRADRQGQGVASATSAGERLAASSVDVMPMGQLLKKAGLFARQIRRGRLALDSLAPPPPHPLPVTPLLESGEALFGDVQSIPVRVPPVPEWVAAPVVAVPVLEDATPRPKPMIQAKPGGVAQSQDGQDAFVVQQVELITAGATPWPVGGAPDGVGEEIMVRLTFSPPSRTDPAVVAAAQGVRTTWAPVFSSSAEADWAEMNQIREVPAVSAVEVVFPADARPGVAVGGDQVPSSIPPEWVAAVGHEVAPVTEEPIWDHLTPVAVEPVVVEPVAVEPVAAEPVAMAPVDVGLDHRFVHELSWMPAFAGMTGMGMTRNPLVIPAKAGIQGSDW
ncbi:MAG: hypothetical protein HQL87_15825, partial [Magnetococcales bacterium]|nr:hypothetical protein [Magnetococcales bacterium]